jgi:ABC-type transport system involved in multi-copper enzyme maturation permease subunit
MKSLFQGIADLPKRYMEVLLAKVGALIVIFAVLILLTVLAAFLLLTKGHFSEIATISICFAPWLIALVVFVGIAIMEKMRLEQEKQDLYELGKQQILVQGLALLMGFLKRNKNKKAKKVRTVEDDE